MDHIQLQRLSAAELAHVLASSAPSSPTWHLAKQECRRRCQRCGEIAGVAGMSIAVCMLLAVFAVLVR
jgi:hypothetical protein